MPVNLETQYEGLATREGFNTSLRHFNLVMEIIAEVEGMTNLADVVNELVADKSIDPPQLKPVVNALLVDRYGYRVSSYNMKDSVESFETILEEAKKWTSVDMVLCYYSPELGLTLINPKNEEHWSAARILKKNELITLYCGAFKQPADKSVCEKAASAMISLLEGRSVKTPAALTGGRFKPPEKKPAPQPRKARAAKRPAKKKTAKRQPAARATAAEEPAAAPTAPPPPPPPSGRARMTPLYGITVTNELFHNGNVEAWKKVIESYETYHSGSRVLVFYEGERIQDINSLFKWGKVKRGTAIMIAVAGDQIKDVAKLQKYLRQGASPLFEAFLKGHPHKVLELF